ncbi:MAG: lipid-A-disaccharide synthase [Ahrensia sp.]|nr:lipid-A-disaccharide synthase [Ahrensia sp.]
MSGSSKRIYFVLGEHSGDALGADLHEALRTQAESRGEALDMTGLAGERLAALGMRSLFDIQDIAVMGITAVASRLPKIVDRVYKVVNDIVRQSPDVIVLIDSPDFTHAVAKRVRRKRPDIAIVNYVCPSVWAWRSGRAKSMRAYVDHVLAILPFEPSALERLNGPPTTYVGHPLERSVADQYPPRDVLAENKRRRLLVLPGSRNTELNQLLSLYGETLRILRNRGHAFDLILPAVPRLKERIARETKGWSVAPEIVNSADNAAHFASADAALIASGTVSLELALHRVPHVSGYKFDAITSPFLRLLNTWSANLPNLIADSVVVPEEINGMVMPERMVRHIEPLLSNTPLRRHQLDGFDRVRAAMRTQKPAGERAAEIIFDLMDRRL